MSQPGSVFSFGEPAPLAGSPGHDLDAARQRLERSESQRSRTHDQLWTLSRLRATTPNMSPAEINFKDRQIYDLQCQLASLEEEVNECKNQLKVAETTILQQRMTIRNQSKAIENPRVVRGGSVTAGQQNYGYGQSNSSQQFNNPAPPSAYGQATQHSVDSQPWRQPYGSALSVQPASAFAPPASTWNQALDSCSSGHGSGSAASGNRSTYGVSTFSSPEHGPTVYGGGSSYMYQDAFSNQIQSLQPTMAPSGFNSVTMAPKSVQELQSPPSATSTNPYPESSLPRGYVPSTTVANTGTNNGQNAKELFRNVFDMTLNYARTHANHPSTAGDNALPQSMKDKLMEAATQKFAFNLMSNNGTRYLLVSRIVVQWMIKHIFKHDKQDTFSGLDGHADKTIQDFKELIFDTTAPHLRFTYLNTIANCSKTVRDNPNFPTFVEHLSGQRSKILWQRICPVMHQKTNNAEGDLLKLMQAAHKLAELLHTTTDEFRFDFLNVETLYDPSVMINIDPTLPTYSTAQLQAAKATVRLCITPVVSSRANTPQGPVMEGVLQKALVLLKLSRC